MHQFRRGLRTLRATCALLAVPALLVSSAAASSLVLPPPGTSAQIVHLVKASTSIQSIPRHMVPPLLRIPYDTATNTSLHAPTVCKSLTRACTFGDRSSKKLVVLFGDSHAWMWVNGVNPAVRAARYRLELLAYPGCPVARVTIWAIPTFHKFLACDTWRAAMIALIRKQHPALVIVSERTSNLYVNATTLVSDRLVTSGLRATITALESSFTKVLVIGDLPTYTNIQAPDACMAIYPSKIQKCSTPVRNPVAAWASHEGAERTAAQRARATFVDPTPWFCTKGTCSPVVGNMATYLNGSHINATYAAYLSGVLGARITALL